MLCPYCHHSDGLHSRPAADGRAADGKLLAPDYEAGKCHHGDCACPGWYPGCDAMQLTAATMRARAERNAVADAPFSLTAPVSLRKSKQGELF